MFSNINGISVKKKIISHTSTSFFIKKYKTIVRLLIEDSFKKNRG